MKTLVALLLLSLLASPAMAQGKGRRNPSDATKPDNAAKRKADNAAYERALKSIPDSKVKVDPWSGAR